MDYKVMKRPMFRKGGPTSAGTGITSGLDTPKRGLVDEPGSYAGEYEKYLGMIPKAFEKTRTGLQNQQSALGPLAVYQALSGGALEGVQDFGDLAMAFGNPAVLQAVGSGMVSKNKLDTQIDALDLKEATTMATLLKPKKTGDNQAVYDKKVSRLNELENIIENLDAQAKTLNPNDPDYAEKIKQNRKEKRRATTEITTTISSNYLTDEKLIRRIESDYFRENGTYPSPEKVAKELAKAKARYAIAGLAEGGRIDKQMGGGFDMGQPQQTMAQPQQTMAQPQGEDPFTILRQRLPKEIPDEVVSLIAYNKKAFADFANIQDQDDVDLFNQKYNVQLVVDLASR